MSRTKNGMLWLILVGLLGLGIVLNVLGGPKWYSLSQLWQPSSQLIHDVIWTMRIPRMLASVFVGILLAMSGALLQTISRNPLADPSILGINAGANLALIIGGVTGIALSIANTVWLALLGAGCAFLIVIFLSMSKNGLDPLRLILGGTIFSGFVSCISFAVSMITNTTQQFKNLLVGGFSGVNYQQVLLLAIVTVIVLAGVTAFRTGFTLLAMDEKTVEGLGISVRTLWLFAAIFVILAAGASVAVGGNIGFVGLGIPQLINVLHPGSFKQNIGLTAVAGGTFMVFADLFAKTAVAGIELPLAGLSALIGGFLLFAIVAFGRQVARS